MQSNNNSDFVRCKYCKDKVQQNLMYAHLLDCKDKHPNYQSTFQTQSKVSSNFQEQNQRQPQQQQQQQQIRGPSQISNKSQIVSEIYQDCKSEKQLYQNQVNQNVPIQTSALQNAGQYTQSLLHKNSQKCVYCNDEYPNELLEEHYEVCEGLKALYKYNDESNSHSHQQKQNYDSGRQQSSQHQQSYQNYVQQNQNIYQQQRQSNPQIQENIQQQIFQRNGPVSYQITEQLLPDGRIKKTTIKTDHITGNTETKIEIIERNQRSQINHNPQMEFIQRPPSSLLSNSHVEIPQRHQIGSQFIIDPFQSNLFSNFAPRRNIIFNPISLLGQLFSNIGLRDKENAMKNLAIIKFTPYQNLEPEYKQCSICFNEYEDGEELILLPCLHRFHSECLKKWFDEQTTCPICKLQVSEQEMPFEDVGDDDY